MDSELVLIRRNDYLASIRADLFDTRAAIREYDKLLQDGKDLLELCKGNRQMRRFKRVVRLEIYTLQKQHKFNLKQEKRLKKLLYKAEKYTPGSNAR